METSELLKKVRRIEIKTRGLSKNIFAGQYHSAFKGRGMAFSEVREYQYGDVIPPQKGKRHILYIIRELIDFHPEEKRTDIGQALKYLTNAIKKRCTAFLISDFINKGSFKDALTIANRKHDVVAIQVYDRRETELPSVGLMKIKDVETGHEQWIDTSSARVRNAYKEWWNKRQAEMDDSFKKCRVDSVSIQTEDDYVKALMALFEKRN